MIGDLNYKEINWDSWVVNAAEDHTSHQFVEAVRDSFLHQHVDFCTRFRNRQQPSMLDLIFTNEEYLIKDLNIPLWEKVVTYPLFSQPNVILRLHVQMNLWKISICIIGETMSR